MDPVTHIASGALGGKLAQQHFEKRQFFWFCVAAAWLPDIDNLLGLLGPEAYLRYHRGMTHSVFGGVALALLLAGVWKLFSRGFPFAKGAVIAYACILLHIFLDLITSYGTLIFAPLTWARYTINAIFIVDPIFTLAIITFLACGRKWKRHSRNIAIAGLCWVLLYPLTAFVTNKVITRYYAQRLEREGLSYNRIELSTEPFSPFLWKLVLEDDTSYRLAAVNTFALSRKLSFETYQKPPPELVKRLEDKVSMLKTFLWFARYPIMRTENNPDKTRLLFNDMRFFSTVGFLRSRSEGDHAPFALVIELDKSGKPLDWQYSEPRGSPTIHYID